MTCNTTSAWLETVLSTARTKTVFPQVDSINDIQSVLRSYRKKLLGTTASLQRLVCHDKQYSEKEIQELSAYLAKRSMFFISQNSDFTLEFFQNFYYFSIQIIVSGEVGNESVDDLIQLAECIVRSIEIYSIVGKDCLPDSLHQPFDEWIKGLSIEPAAELQDAVLGAVCVFMGRLKDPFCDECQKDSEDINGKK